MPKNYTDQEIKEKVESIRLEEGLGEYVNTKEYDDLTHEQERIVKSFVASLVDQGIDVFAVDLDDTITKFHTFIANLNKISIDSSPEELFANLAMLKAMINELHKFGIEVALITYQNHDKVQEVLKIGGLLEGYFDCIYATGKLGENTGLSAEEREKRKQYRDSIIREDKEIDKKQLAIEEVAAVYEEFQLISKVFMVSDKDPEILSWLENQGGVTFGIDEFRYCAIKEISEEREEDLESFIDYIIENEEDWAKIPDENINEEYASIYGCDSRQQLQESVRYCRLWSRKLKEYRAYKARHGIETYSLETKDLPLPPMEAPRREVPERTLASGGDLQGREIGLTQDNFNRMFRETLLVGVMDGKITEERAMILAGENEDLRAKLQEAFKTIKSPPRPTAPKPGAAAAECPPPAAQPVAAAAAASKRFDEIPDHSEEDDRSYFAKFYNAMKKATPDSEKSVEVGDIKLFFADKKDDSTIVDGAKKYSFSIVKGIGDRALRYKIDITENSIGDKVFSLKCEKRSALYAGMENPDDEHNWQAFGFGNPENIAINTTSVQEEVREAMIKMAKEVNQNRQNEAGRSAARS